MSYDQPLPLEVLAETKIQLSELLAGRGVVPPWMTRDAAIARTAQEASALHNHIKRHGNVWPETPVRDLDQVPYGC